MSIEWLKEARKTEAKARNVGCRTRKGFHQSAQDVGK